MLVKKLVRDIFLNWKSFIAVFIICMLAVTLYIGIDAGWRGMEKNLTMQFIKCATSDLWISGELSDRAIREIAELPGVDGAQRRARIRAKVVSFEHEPKLDVYMSGGMPTVNTPLVLSGELFSGDVKNQCVLSEEFALANGLSVGDTLTIRYQGYDVELTVRALGFSSEYVVFNDGYGFKTDAETFGYAYVSPGTIGFAPYSETVVKLSEGADTPAVKAQIEALLDDPLKTVLTRDDKYGIKMAIEEVEQVRALGQVFPMVFFLVAALITWSTMKRLNDNQREQIGTLRSLGYTKAQLTLHYTGYGFFISVAGSLIGIIFAKYFVGAVVMRMLSSIYVMPGASAYLNPATAAGVCALVVLIASGASYLSCRRALSDTPSNLLRPKPPQHGKRVLLERIPFLWRHFSFSAKMVMRNISRNAPRFIIGMIGITGCTALLLTGFGMRDSVAFVMNNHYGVTMRYDAKVTLNAECTDDYLYAIAARAGAERMEAIQEGSCEIDLCGEWTTKSLYILEDGHDMVYLEDTNGRRVWLPENGAMITAMAMEETDIFPGDVVKVRMRNGNTAEITITGVISMQLGQGIYMSRSALRQLDVMSFVPTALMLQGDSLGLAAISDMDGVDRAHTLLEDRNSYGMVLDVMDLIIYIMILFSGALAFVVLFTLGQLNFFERQRELATLMVLGFYPRENKRIILRENIIIAVCGIPVGLLLGPYLHEWVLDSGLPKTLEFIPYIARESWIYTCLMALLFAQIVNLIVGWKFKRLNMVEALKSVE